MSYSKEDIEAEMIRREMEKRDMKSYDQRVPVKPGGPSWENVGGTLNTPTQYEAPISDENLPWETVGGRITTPDPRKKEPGFMKNMALIESSLAKGTLAMTGRIATAFERVLRLGGEPTAVPNAINYWTDKQKSLQDEYQYSPVVQGLAGAGEVGAELVTTAPVSIPFKAVSAASAALGAGKAILPGLINKGLPIGTRKLGEYATSVGGGAGILSGMSGLRASPGDNRLFSPEQSKETLQNPASYALPMAATMVGNYLKSAQRFGQATEQFPGAIPRFTREKGPVKTALHLVFDSLPMLTHMGKAFNQKELVGPAISEVIRKLARSSKTLNASDLTTNIARNVQAGYKKLQVEETRLWEQPGFKNVIITDSKSVLDITNQAKQIIKDTKLPTYGRARALLEEEISDISPIKSKILDTTGRNFVLPPSGNLTVNDVKNIQEVINKATQDAYKLGGTGNEIGKTLGELRNKLFDPIQQSLSAKELEAFILAKTHSRGMYQLGDEFGNIVEATKKEAEAIKIAQSLAKDSYKFEAAKRGNLISDKGSQEVKALNVASAMEAAQDVEGMHLGKFLNHVDPTWGTSITKKILNPSEFDYLKGLTTYVRSMHQANKIGAAGRTIGLSVGLVSAAGIGAGTAEVSDDNRGWAAVVTYPAMLFLSNHPVLKRFLGLSMRNISPSVSDHINKKIQDISIRAGYFLNERGALDIKEKRGK